MKNIFNYLVLFVIIFSNTILARDYLIIQSTTSTVSTGLLEYLSDAFFKETGIEIRTVGVGTGQAIKNATRGDADILLVHSKTDEIKFVEEGLGIKRYDLMYNDFVIVGPKADPAKIKNLKDLKSILKNLSSGNFKFLSRDDNSGTHKKEIFLWSKFNFNFKENGSYIKTGSGMISTLNMASEMNAYTITDRATWIAFKNKDFLEILFEGDENLFNPYGIIALNPEKYPHVEFVKSNQFINWLLSDRGKNLINNFKVSNNQLFFIYE
ncbi:MAG: substrate-binding domain-containing protein [Proteobacteria bacterium]|nr:substrate-binding domain-containing protein [Pseudomonadota bacterium]